MSEFGQILVGLAILVLAIAYGALVAPQPLRPLQGFLAGLGLFLLLAAILAAGRKWLS